MDVTVYLPDELGEWAKASGVNLSGTLRAALEALRVRSDELADAAEVRLDLEDRDGRSYVGRFTGVEIVEGVYLTEDDRVLVHDVKRAAVVEIEDEEELRDWLSAEDYVDACNRLGWTAVVDL